MTAVTTEVTIGTPVPTPMPTPTGNGDLAEGEATRGEADEAAREAEHGDDLAARAFEEIREFGERGIEGGVSAGIGRTGTGQRDQGGQDVVLEPGTPGKLERGIHGQELQGLKKQQAARTVRCLFFVIPRCPCRKSRRRFAAARPSKKRHGPRRQPAIAQPEHHKRHLRPDIARGRPDSARFGSAFLRESLSPSDSRLPPMFLLCSFRFPTPFLFA
jgi:hypothetical protein